MFVITAGKRMKVLGLSLAHILSELKRLDFIIQVQVSDIRQTQGTDPDLQGLVISDQEVNGLLAETPGLASKILHSSKSLPEHKKTIEAIEKEIQSIRHEVAREGVTLRLDHLAQRFHLTPFEVDVILICLAPELDLHYERLYAYLQDDVTRRHPSVGLAVDLLCSSLEEQLTARQHFAKDAPLFRNGLLEMWEDASHPRPHFLGRCLKVDERIAAYLLGSDRLDARLIPYASLDSAEIPVDGLALSAEFTTSLQKIIATALKDAKPQVLYLQGLAGAGRQTAVSAIFHAQGKELIVLDAERLTELDESGIHTLAMRVGRESILREAVLYIDHFDTLFASEHQSWLTALSDGLTQIWKTQPVTLFASGEVTWQPVKAWEQADCLTVDFPRLSAIERARLWSEALTRKPTGITPEEMKALVGKFKLGVGQIRAAAREAEQLAACENPENRQIQISHLYAACRAQSNHKLATLAHKIEPHYTWKDIILPADRLEQLREICNHARYRGRVYDEWGFERKLSLGKGLNILFSGPSGTGKTMAAEIMAGELGQDVYKIDLSTVVSKYIGETEKNLARIFAEAETSNAILFFDEADALFGKRSEVRDAHDRYANIEIAYLLQKMDEYEGVVILATNLRKNMDEAFVRRMHFTVEFPLPGERDCLRIWEGIWPAQTPVSEALDLGLLAHRFELTGGNIRNVALAAAFLAVADGQVVDMSHLLHATQREYQKMGKVMALREFEVQDEHA